MILRVLIDGYSLVVLASVILSWIRLDPDNPLVKIVGTLTEPVLGPIRRILPDFGGIDFSPMLLLLALRFLRGLLVH
jgi:YggT family protein